MSHGALRYYIATKLERASVHNEVRDRLREFGHTLTYDWTVHGSVKNEGAERIRAVAVAETQGVLAANYVVVLLPGGRGTHTELGMAIASGKRVFLHARNADDFFGYDERTCAFYHHPLVTQVTGPLPIIIAPISEWMSETPNCRRCGHTRHDDIICRALTCTCGEKP